MRRRTESSLERLLVAPHYVYRALDSYGHLLYVGCTNNPDKRLATHRHQAPWFRFAETVAVAGPYDGRDAARKVEMTAILTEGPYFNSSPQNHAANQANLNAAKRAMWDRGWHCPDIDPDMDPREDLEAFYAACEEIRPGQEAWRRGLERERERLKAGAYPYMTDADRMARYLSAREDAEGARLAVAS